MNIALVAHDGRKKELIDWVSYNAESLSKHKLFATGTTGKLIEQIVIESDYGGYWSPFTHKVTV